MYLDDVKAYKSIAKIGSVVNANKCKDYDLQNMHISKLILVTASTLTLFLSISVPVKTKEIDHKFIN